MRTARNTPWKARTATLIFMAWVLTAVAAPSAWAVSTISSGESAPRGTPTATHFNGIPTVGALFSAGGRGHFCSAAVVDSAPGDLVITAAHCVYSASGGYARNLQFVPGYHNGRRPYGSWTVEKITVARSWREWQNPNLDVAFLTVGRPGTRIQDRTGGLWLGTGRPYRQTVEPVGYNDTDGRPVKCRTKAFEFRWSQRELYCHALWDGTSGGPWITGFDSRTGTGTVTGVIGGYEQGGDYDWASYSPYFGSSVLTLFLRAGGAT